jgi:hypothetical protein
MSSDLPEGNGAAGGDIFDPGAGGRVGGQAAQQPARERLARQVGLPLPGAELAEPRRGHDTLHTGGGKAYLTERGKIFKQGQD